MHFTLRSTDRSPFGRKVRIAASVLGLTADISIVEADPMSPDDTIRVQNPLGKIPALILDDGQAIYDSRVIIEYLDTVAGGKLIPVETAPRFAALTLASLADGILDAGILIVYESRFRTDREPHEPWLDYQRGKIERGLSALASQLPAIEPPTIASIGAACALGYIDFRKQVDWRAQHPSLIDWLDAFAAAVPAFNETLPPA